MLTKNKHKAVIWFLVFIALAIFLFVLMNNRSYHTEKSGKPDYVFKPNGVKMQYKFVCLDFVEYIITVEGGIAPHYKSGTEVYSCNYINNGEMFNPK